MSSLNNIKLVPIGSSSISNLESSQAPITVSRRNGILATHPISVQEQITPRSFPSNLKVESSKEISINSTISQPLLTLDYPYYSSPLKGSKDGEYLLRDEGIETENEQEKEMRELLVPFYDSSKSPLDQKSVNLPGSLTFSSYNSSIYFGIEAKTKFNEKISKLYKQKMILSSNFDENISPEIVFAIKSVNEIYSENKETSDQAPFTPNRKKRLLSNTVSSSSSVNTKILVRKHYGLEKDSKYNQQLFVPDSSTKVDVSSDCMVNTYSNNLDLTYLTSVEVEADRKAKEFTENKLKESKVSQDYMELMAKHLYKSALTDLDGLNPSSEIIYTGINTLPTFLPPPKIEEILTDANDVSSQCSINSQTSSINSYNTKKPPSLVIESRPTTASALSTPQVSTKTSNKFGSKSNYSSPISTIHKKIKAPLFSPSKTSSKPIKSSKNLSSVISLPQIVNNGETNPKSSKGNKEGFFKDNFSDDTQSISVSTGPIVSGTQVSGVNELLKDSLSGKFHVEPIFSPSSPSISPALSPIHSPTVSSKSLTSDYNQRTESFDNLYRKHLNQHNPSINLLNHSPKLLQFVCIDSRDSNNLKEKDSYETINSENNAILSEVWPEKNSLQFYYEKDSISQQYQDVDSELKLWAEDSPISPMKVIVNNFSKKNEKTKSKVMNIRRKLPLDIPENVANNTDKLVELNLTSRSNVSNESDQIILLSPRSRFIDSCLRKRLNPRASCILRKTFTRELNLKHMGIGDDMAVMLAEAIVDIPYIESLNICDNNLNDLGLSAIINSVRNMKNLVDLDMSMNVIGPEAAESLNNYLSVPNCPLKKLTLQKADVDDDECQHFITALLFNRSLKVLDLSDNKVGSNENLNTVMPDLITGGEAIADLLSSPECPLETLKLGWNMLRLDGAASLCSSISLNTSLIFLELSYNSLGSQGGVALGNSLQDNKTLKTLLLSNNSIDSIACLTICAGILENTTLEYVSFDGNPIGEQGAKALMLLPTIVGSRVKVSSRNCNIHIRDPNNWFDSLSLIRKFDLDLSNPFERSVAIIILYLIPSHQTYIVAHSEYYDVDKKESIQIKLKEEVDREYYISRASNDPDQMKLLNGLNLVIEACNDIRKAAQLFKDMDEDGSGELDEEEFSKLLDAIGMDMSEGRAAEVMAEYDPDGVGVISMNEFLKFLKVQKKQATKRLRELTEFPILISEYYQKLEAQNLGISPTSLTPKRYSPPRKGKLKLVIIDGFTQKDTFHVISPDDRTNILKVASQSGELLTMTSFGMKNYKVRFDEARVMVHSLLMENADKVNILATVLPQIATASDAKLLVNKVLKQNILEISRLKREIGHAYRVIMGYPDGFYVLDMSNEMDRFCLNRLLEISMTRLHLRSVKRNCLGYGRLGDTSQHGNFSCFRNEIFNKRSIIINSEFASPLPRTGHVEFDFVSQTRYSSENHYLSDSRFINLITKSFLLNQNEKKKAIEKLNRVKAQCNSTLNGDGHIVYSPSKLMSIEIAHHMNVFYENLFDRKDQIDDYKQKESVKANWEFDPNIFELSYLTHSCVYTVPPIFKSSLDNMIEKKRARLESMSQTIAEKDDDAIQNTSDVNSIEKKESGSESESESDLENNSLMKEIEETEEEEIDILYEKQELENYENDKLEYLLPVTPLFSPDVIGSEQKSLSKDPKIKSKSTQSKSNSTTSRRSSISTKTPKKSIKSSSIDISKKESINSGSILNDNVIISAAIAAVNALEVEEEPKYFHYDPEGNNYIDFYGDESHEEIEKKFKNLGRRNSLVSIESSNKRLAQPLSDMWNRYICMMGSRNIPLHAKASKTLEVLIDIFESQFILCRQMEILLIVFHSHFGSLYTSDDFGTYRVELIVKLFHSIVDIHNFEIILRSLTPKEHACVICRIGYLNIYNPMKPESFYQLDLSRNEERTIVKILAALAVIEPGDNLTSLTFRWDLTANPMPGYELTEPWLTEEGMPRKGIWNAEYYSGEGLGKKSCKPVIKFRRALLQLVLIEEEEVIKEEDLEDEDFTPPILGPQTIFSNVGIWHNYLAYDEDASKSFKEKKAAASNTGKKRR